MELKLERIGDRINRVDLLDDNGKFLFTITRWRSRGLQLLAADGDVLDLYYIYRHPLAVQQRTRFRHGLDLISRLMRKQGLSYHGLFWGSAVSARYLGDRWFALGNTLLISESGRLSDPLKDTLQRYYKTNADVNPFLLRARIYIRR